VGEPEQNIRECYSLLSKYEAIRCDTDRPEERKRAQRIIDEQWDLIRGYLDEYLPLCQRFGVTIPNDIAQIAARFAGEVSATSGNKGGTEREKAPAHPIEAPAQAGRIQRSPEIAQERSMARRRLVVAVIISAVLSLLVGHLVYHVPLAAIILRV